MRTKGLSRHQKLVLDVMYQINQAWFSATEFAYLLGFQKAEVTLRSLERRRLLVQKTVRQADIDPRMETEEPAGVYGLSTEGAVWVRGREEWFSRNQWCKRRVSRGAGERKQRETSGQEMRDGGR